MSLLQRVLDRFRPPVTTVQVDGGEIVFQNGTDEARAQPLIRFAENGKIMAIGESAGTAEGGRLVRLFEADGGTEEEIRAFCRYHLMLTANAMLLRPRVTIVEPSFRRAFGPQAASDLLRVLRADGFQAEIAHAS